MKNILLLTTIILFLASCGGGEAEMPEDLAGKKKYLQTKKTELNSLKAEIASVEAAIEKLEPKKEKSKRLVSTKMAKVMDFNHFVAVSYTHLTLPTICSV